MSLLARYQGDVDSRKLQADPGQLVALQHLQAVLDQLHQSTQLPKKRYFWQRLRTQDPSQSTTTGLYLWGSVGRGKTYLMDLFYAQAQCSKQRFHFHRFMYRVHEQLNQLADCRDPLAQVAQHWASQGRLLCLDEFLVEDITDAMILYRLLVHLGEQSVTLVTTSNTPPDELYPNGLQRQRFLPAIDWLNTHNQVVLIPSGQDHRQNNSGHRRYLQAPVDHQLAKTEQLLKTLTSESGLRQDPLIIDQRAIQVCCRSARVLWCNFSQICAGPRSQRDYLQLARIYHTVLITQVPRLDQANDQARRFMHLVDIFYDQKVCLYLASEYPLTELYCQGTLKASFERILSRLTEMQSPHYPPQNQ